MKRLKIAILAERMLPGSIPKIISAETRYLKRFGHEVDVLTLMEGGLSPKSYQFQEFLDSIHIRVLSREFSIAKFFDFKLPFFSFLSGYHLMGPFFVPHVIKEKEYDVIIAFNALTCLTAYRIWQRCKIPYVAYVWDPFSYILVKVYSQRLPKVILHQLLKVASWLDRFIVENSLVTITLSKSHADLLRSLTNKKDIEVVYMGCHPLGHIPERRGDYLLAIDRWDRGNMPHVLLEIMERLKGKGSLLVAGFCSEGWIQESFIKMREKKGLTERVRWLGPVSEKELNKLYIGARAWIHPIEETSVSMPALEAAGHGCPIIMPQSTPLFKHGVHGFFPAEGNLGEYAEYVDQLLGDEHLAWRMGYEAWEVAKKYTWEYHAKRLEEIIKKHAMFKG
jgi:glycosyltransferase involved in cell wall biosynthesis